MTSQLEEILPQIYQAEIPLPGNPLKATNSYIIKGKDRSLIIDTGMNRKVCMDAMSQALRELNLDLSKTDLFITHLHADHLGLAGVLSSPSSRVFFNGPDAEIMEMKNLWKEMSRVAVQYGFPHSEDAVEKHPGNRYSPREALSFSIVQEGDRISCGEYNFTCIETPGHTRGHICLYETDQKIFISGDHILGDITPNISSWDDLRNPLDDYLASLDKVYAIDIDLVLPGHRSRITDCRKRIYELKEHHRNRLDEIVQILNTHGPSTAYQIASQMTWDIKADNWEMFPLMQKWFATGEAIAHLKYLEVEGSIHRSYSGGTIQYTPL